jgi:uncharacterized membrane protein
MAVDGAMIGTFGGRGKFWLIGSLLVAGAAFLLAGTFVPPAVAAVAAGYSAVPLQGPAGTCIADAKAVNDLGDAAGVAQFPGSQPANTSSVYAFSWHAGSLTRLTLGDPAFAPVQGAGSCFDNPNSVANDLNDAGTVVGWSYFKDPNPANVDDRLAAVWSSGGGAPTSLGLLSSDPTKCFNSAPSFVSEADAINAAGDIAGYSTFCTTGGIGDYDAFFLPHGGRLGTSGQMIADSPAGIATGVAINRSDQIVVNFQPPLSSSANESELWSKGTNRLTQLPFIASFWPNVLNDAGVVVGTDNNRPVYSTNAGAVRHLTPAGGLPNGYANGVNSGGDVVGYSFGNGHQIATLWPGAVPPAKGSPAPPIDLQALLPAGSPQLVAGLAISNNGTILASSSSGYEILIPCSASAGAADDSAPAAGGVEGVAAASDTGSCPLTVKVTPIDGGKAGLSYHRPSAAFLGGAVANGLGGSVDRTCLSGCTDLRVTVTDPHDLKGGKPARVADAEIEATLTPIARDDIAKGYPSGSSPGTGYLCELRALRGADNVLLGLDATDNCNARLLHGVTTDDQGQVYLRYWAPGLITDPSTPVTVNVQARKPCSSKGCSLKSGTGTASPPVNPKAFVVYKQSAPLPKIDGFWLAVYRALHTGGTKVFRKVIEFALSGGFGAAEKELVEQLAEKGGEHVREELANKAAPALFTAEGLTELFLEQLFKERVPDDGLGPGGGYLFTKFGEKGLRKERFIEAFAGGPGVIDPNGGLLWKFGDALYKIEQQDHDIPDQTVTLTIYEVSYCAQEAQTLCGPGYLNGELRGAEPYKGIHSFLAFDLHSEQGANNTTFDGSVVVPYEAQTWMQQRFGK